LSRKAVLEFETDELLSGLVVSGVELLNVLCAVLKGIVLFFDVRLEVIGNRVEWNLCDLDFVR